MGFSLNCLLSLYRYTLFLTKPLQIIIIKVIYDTFNLVSTISYASIGVIEK